MTDEQIELAGMMIKVLDLANTPGMDEIAIKLNCGLTYDEKETAQMWAKAFELAEKGGKLFTLAAKLHKSL